MRTWKKIFLYEHDGYELRHCAFALCTELSKVDYKDKEFDASQIEPGWHAWMSYLVDKPPGEDKLLVTGLRPWEPKEPKINLTLSRAAYRPYSTTKPKYSAWEPVAKPRDGSSPFAERDIREGAEFEAWS